jgi:hypothetical protein
MRLVLVQILQLLGVHTMCYATVECLERSPASLLGQPSISKLLDDAGMTVYPSSGLKVRRGAVAGTAFEAEAVLIIPRSDVAISLHR